MLCDLPSGFDAVENGTIKRRKTIKNLGNSIWGIFFLDWYMLLEFRA